MNGYGRFGGPPAQPSTEQKLVNALMASQRRIEGLEKGLDEMKAMLRSVSDAPKWIEEIPGRRVPYFASIDITIAASSTSKVEGTFTVSTDGPFSCIGIAMFFQRTTAPYNGMWALATTVNAKIANASQQLGFGYLFDSPLMGSFDVEVAESGSDRNWQNNPFASALFSASTGGVYVLPVANLFGRSSVATVRVTPTVAQTVAGKVQVLLLGYKIVQPDTYQP